MRIVLVFPLLLVLTAFLSCFVGFAAHWFLHVLNETAQGRNDVPVRWPGEGYYEKLWNAGYLTALTGAAFLPAFLLLRVLGLWQGENASHVVLAVLLVAVVVWLLLPILLLSVLSSQHHWEIFRWKVVRAFARNPRLIGAFFAASAPLVIGGVLVIHFAVAGWREFQEAAVASPLAWLPDVLAFWSWLFVLPLAGAFCAAALLIYARLLGRLAWMLDLAEIQEDEPEPKASAPATSDLVASHDLLEPATPMATGSEETYGLQEEEPASVLPAGPIPEHAMPAPSLAVAAQRFASLPPEVPMPQRVLPSPILEVPVKGPTQRRLLVRGIFQFPWYRGSLVAWIVLTLGSLFTLLLVRLMVLVLD